MKLLSLFFCFFLVSFSCSADENQPLLPPRLSVSGTAVLHKPADLFSLNIGVITQNDDAETALKLNSDQMQKVISALTTAGLTKSEMKTGQFSVRPMYTEPPKILPPNWTPKIKGYEVTNSLIIETQQLSSAGTIIDAANSAGANSIDNIRFGLKDPRAFREEAIQTAASHAITDAKTLAAASKVKLVRALVINLDNTPSPPVSPVLFKRSLGDSAPPIEEGDVEVRAHVQIIYEIES